MTLNNNQKKYLRGLAQSKKPVLIIGQNGLTDNILEALSNILNSHELIKIKIHIDNRDEKQQIIDVLLSHAKGQCVQTIGGIFVLYKPFMDKPIIILPK